MVILLSVRVGVLGLQWFEKRPVFHVLVRVSVHGIYS